MLRVPFLAVDDVFTGYTQSEAAAAFNASMLYELMEARIGKWTLFASNVAPQDMPDARLASRLVRWGNEVINMQGAQDYGVLQFQRREAGRKEVQA